MRKVLLLSLTLGAAALYADDYPYLTFETADGTTTSVRTTSLTITIDGDKLTAGSHTFELADLSKMYFTDSDQSATTVIESIADSDVDGLLADDAEIYDLNGRKMPDVKSLNGNLPRGIYVIKTKKGTRKVNVK